MKKHSALMRASGILLVLTLGTSCFVGGTFAKYVTEKEANDSARVAKWGVTVKFENPDFFSTAYGKDDVNVESWTAQVDIDGDGEKDVVSVWNNGSSDDMNLIAPGTKKEFGGIRIDGTPEVTVNVKTVATVDLGDEDDWTVDNKFYCPLVFNIGGYVIEGLDYSAGTTGGLATLESDIKKAIEATVNGVYPANTPLDAAGKWEEYNQNNAGNYGPQENGVRAEDLFCDYDKDGYVDFMWAWPFEKKDNGTQVTWYNGVSSTLKGDYNDELDTLLGDKFLDDKAPEISIKVTTTVTQID